LSYSVLSVFIKVVYTYLFSLFLESGKLYSFGASNEGQLGFDSGNHDRVAVPTEFSLPDSSVTVKTVYAGGNHSACLSGSYIQWKHLQWNWLQILIQVSFALVCCFACSVNEHFLQLKWSTGPLWPLIIYFKWHQL